MVVKTRMTSTEFIDFAHLPENAEQRMQLIDGELHMAARPIPNHQRFVLDVGSLIAKVMPGGEVIADVNLHLAEGHNYEPDVIWLAEASACHETAIGFEGPPELVIEVLSNSTAQLDKGPKFRAYERYGVREYWLADVQQRLVEIYQRDGEKLRRSGAFGPDDTVASLALGVDVPLRAAFHRIKTD